MRFITTLLLTAIKTSALKVGLISDLHLNLNYDANYGPRANAEGDCWATSGTYTDVAAHFGRYGCDPPMALLEVMLEEFNVRHGKQDVIIITGDLSSHHTAMKYPMTDEDTYPLLLATHSGIASLLTQKFPDTIILPAFGNNDCKYHDNPAPIDEQTEFYDFVYNLWFQLLPGNVDSFDSQQKEAIHESFLKGGYYRVDINDSLSVLSMNTLYFDSLSDEEIDSHSVGDEQMVWLQQ